MTDSGQRKASTSSAGQSKNEKAKTMGDQGQAQQQKPDLQKLMHLVHSSDIQAANESTSALREMLLNGKIIFCYVVGLVFGEGPTYGRFQQMRWVSFSWTPGIL